MELHQQVLIISLSHIHKDRVDDIQRVSRLVDRQVESGQPQLNSVLEGCTLLFHAPSDEVLTQLNLQILRVGHLSDIINEVLRNLGCAWLAEYFEDFLVPG